jgi:hypothetical protein
MSSQANGVCCKLLTAAYGGNFKAHAAGILQRHMTESSNAVNGH